ncbi:hypothetical protein [Oceanobacillus senegalensis]|uniref:hypothetical protein n=1 Tax=Oceanobacillus senegalensis TaxID=1936063 RepID=UPI000A30927B|nr:hypothetical protein [Oceanobacillus senegalensis]
MLLKGKYKKIAPASGAIIMANGIFLIGAVQAFPFLDKDVGVYLAFLLLLAWIFIYSRLSIQFVHRDFLIPFLKHPVNSFAIGTWIAGVSVLCNVFLKYFPEILPVTQAMGILNTFLFLFFLVNCFYNFKQLFFDHQNFPAHGVVLLSAVGTQSIIVLLNNVFFELPKIISSSIIMLGVFFYILGMVLIINRYIRQNGWTLVDDWTNTNCIIHGALSITGLAIVSSNTFTTLFAIILWIIIFILIVIVEVLEIIRAIKRIKVYGWKEGVFKYNVTQWSRNFTFGMFYAFTSVMQVNPYYPMPTWLDNFQHVFMPFWAWIVLLALLGQIVVYIRSRLITEELVQKRNLV